ncbi:MAG TPA: phosphotransferase family protein [Candidatus Limnocylindrales bacterium]|nr:phosphotransferase family protein [Candidatus Limnocylindrales bacterium]
MSSPIGLDLEKLASYMDTGPLSGELIAGGKSNLTYKVLAGQETWIVRRPPLGHVLATAHDMSREHRIVTALRPTGVPVPRTIALCDDVSVIGAPFYIMQFVEGAIYRTSHEAAALGRERLDRITGSLTEVLARLHAVDPATVGLRDFGRPDGYMQRQLSRWRKQLDASRSRDLPGIDELHARLELTVPATKHIGIVHGDYKLDNVIVSESTDEVAAVLDWEMSTLGDQLADVGLLLMYWERLTKGGDLFGEPAPPGDWYPSGDALTEKYARASGADLSRLNWYIAFANFKLAVIAEGIHFRFISGQTVGEGFERIGEGVPVFVARGHELLAQEE